VSEKGKDKLFLAYANYSLREDPKNFIKIFDVGDRCDSFLPTSKKRLRAQIEDVVECEFSKKADPNVRRLISNMDLKYAIEAIYGYRHGFCEHECPVRKIREEKWGREPFEGPDRWKCVECDQCDFVRILKDIIDGNFSEVIDSLLTFIKTVPRYLAETSDTHPVTERSGKKLEDDSTSRDPLFSLDDTSSKYTFREYWNGLIYIDLLEFLKEDDDNWQRLKLCPYCNEFFTATSKDKEICYSQDCRKAYNREQKKHYMRRKRDPDSREFDLRYKTREFPKKKPS